MNVNVNDFYLGGSHTSQGFVLEKIQVGTKWYVLFYNPDINVVRVNPAKPDDIYETAIYSVDVQVNDTQRGDRQEWGPGGQYSAFNHAYYTVNGETWRVLLDTVGFPFIVDKNLDLL